MDITNLLEQINPSMWVFLGVLVTAGLAYFSTRNKHKTEGAIALVEASVLLTEQYRLSSEECQQELQACKKSLKARPKRRKR